MEVAELAVFCNAKRSRDDHHNAKTSFVMMVMLMTKMRMMRDRNLGQPRRRKQKQKKNTAAHGRPQGSAIAPTDALGNPATSDDRTHTPQLEGARSFNDFLPWTCIQQTMHR